MANKYANNVSLGIDDTRICIYIYRLIPTRHTFLFSHRLARVSTCAPGIIHFFPGDLLMRQITYSPLILNTENLTGFWFPVKYRHRASSEIQIFCLPYRNRDIFVRGAEKFFVLSLIRFCKNQKQKYRMSNLKTVGSYWLEKLEAKQKLINQSNCGADEIKSIVYIYYCELNYSHQAVVADKLASSHFDCK